MNSSIFDNLPAGSFLDVMVSLNGKTKTRNLKVCKVKPRSVLFILVDKPNRVNTFFKIKYSDIEEYFNAIGLLTLKDGKIPDKWESEWDNIGNFSPMVAGSSSSRMGFVPRPIGYRPNYSNHSKGWAPTIRAPKGASMDALAVSVATRSTTNSSTGFPMV